MHGTWTTRGIALLSLLLIGIAAGSEATVADERMVGSACLKPDGATLLGFFRKRTNPKASREEVLALVNQLGAKDHERRDQAVAELVGLGTEAVPWLRQAVQDPDERERMRLAQHCLRLIETGGSQSVSAAAARLVAARSPPGAAAALLAYLPFAETEVVADEVRAALTSLAFQGGQPDQALVAGLDDPLPVRRAAAATALCRAGKAGAVPLVRRLLKDPKSTVRLRTALAVVAVHEPEAIDVLIDLLGDLPLPQGKQAEDALRRLAGGLAPSEQLAADEGARNKCRDAWIAWWRGTLDKDLLDFFRRRTLTEADRERVTKLIQQLGDNSFEVREKATEELATLKNLAAPLLRKALRSPDIEVVQRIQECLKQLAKDKSVQLTPAIAAHLLMYRKPEGATATLLAFLPFAEDEADAEAVRDALGTIGWRDGRPDPSLTAALGDAAPERRLLAAELLGQAGVPEARHALRGSLKDSDLRIRLRAALVLAEAREKDAIPVLIALLGELPQALGSKADEVLQRVAGATAPKGTLGSDDDSRLRRSIAWMAWWSANGSKLDLSGSDSR